MPLGESRDLESQEPEAKTAPECVLFLGLGQFGEQLSFTEFKKFSLPPASINIVRVHDLTQIKSLESHNPFIVFLALNNQSEGTIGKIRQSWPFASIVVTGPMEKIHEAYPLLAVGASDFVSMSATTMDIQEKCLLRLGAFRQKSEKHSLALGNLTVNLLHRTISNGNESASLTPIEIKIVSMLADNVGQVVKREIMKRSCWGDLDITDNALNRKIYEVRRILRKLSEDMNIRTIYGLGFELTHRQS